MVVERSLCVLYTPSNSLIQISETEFNLVKQNTMSDRTNELVINQIKLEMEERKVARRRAAIMRKKDMPLTLRFIYGAKQLGIAWYSRPYLAGEMVKKFKDHQSDDYKVAIDRSIEAVMWWAAKEENIFDEKKIAKAIKKTKAYDPSNKLKLLRFVRAHSVVSISALVIVVLVISSIFVSLSIRYNHTLLGFMLIVFGYIIDFMLVNKFINIWKER